MSRRPPSDTFTRFTSTTPHATHRPATTFSYQPSSRSGSSPSTSASQPSSSGKPPPNETPLEKVARLRAAHQAAKTAAAYSPLDRFISAGRRWADRAHRFTAYGLILFAGISSVVAAYGTFSLVAYSRRQKRAFVQRELDRLDDARRAFLRGDANAEQLHLLEQERAGQEMELARMREAERKKREGLWGRVKGLVGAQAASGEMGDETEGERSAREARMARRDQGTGTENEIVEGQIPVEVKPGKLAVPAQPSGIVGVGVDSKGRPVPAGKVEYLSSEVEDERRTGERDVAARTGVTAGPLDALADNIAGAVAPKTEGQGWLSWIRGSKS